MKKANLSKREISKFIFAVLLIAGYLYYAGVVEPLLSRSKALDESISAKDKELKLIIETIKKSKTMEEEYKNIVDVFKQKGKDEEVMSLLLNEIEGSSKKVNIVISDMKPQKVKDHNFIITSLLA